MVEINNSRDATKTVKIWLWVHNVLGWTKNDNRRKLVRIDRYLNSKRCLSFLWSYFLSDFKDDDLVQHDGASCKKKKFSWG